MLFFTSDQICYSRTAILAATLGIVVVPAVGAWALHLDYCFLDERFLPVLDYALACIIFGGAGVTYLKANLSAPCERLELYAMRVATSLVVCGCTLTIVVSLLPRAVLFASAVLTHALFLNVATWVTSLVLRLQTGGLAGFLPRPVESLISTPPLELLSHAAGTEAQQVAQLVHTVRQVAALLLLSPEDQQEALQLVPPPLRARLQHSVRTELPHGVQQVLEPWADGPSHLKVTDLDLAETLALGVDQAKVLAKELGLEHAKRGLAHLAPSATPGGFATPTRARPETANEHAAAFRARRRGSAAPASRPK